MPVHEKQAQLANDYGKVGLNGKAGGRVEDPNSTDVQYALGDVSPAQTATAAGTTPDTITITASSPAAGQIQVVLPAHQDEADYQVFRGGTLVATEADSGTKTYSGQPVGTHNVTATVRDADGTVIANSNTVSVTVA